MIDIDEIIKRAEKLQALAQSSNVHEAALAASKLQELLLKYNLELWETQEAPRRYGYREFNLSAGGYGSSLEWKKILLATIARANSCKAVSFRGMPVSRVFGESLNINVCRHMYKYLAQEICRLEEIAWQAIILGPSKNKAGMSRERGTLARSFYVGAVDAIYLRLERPEQPVVGSALVYVETVQAELDEAIRNNLGEIRQSKASSKVNTALYNAGMIAGGGINLDDQLGSATEEAGLYALGA